MNRLTTLITLLLFVNMIQPAYPQSLSKIVQQTEVKTNSLSTADVNPAGSGELIVVQTTGVPGDNAVVVQKLSLIHI